MTHAEKVLQLLRDGKPHTCHELYSLGVIAHSRVSDLRKRGYSIAHFIDKGEHCYRLEAFPRGDNYAPARALSPSENASGESPAQVPEQAMLAMRRVPAVTPAVQALSPENCEQLTLGAVA